MLDGGCGRGDVEKAGFAVTRHGEAVARHGERFYQVAIMVIEGGLEGGVDRKIELARVTGRDPDALEFSVFKADEERAVGAAVLGAREAGDIIPGRISLGVQLVRRLERNARGIALVLGRCERIGVQRVTSCDEQARLVDREEQLQLAFPQPGERTGYELLFLPGPVRHGVVLDLDQRTPEWEALRQALGWPGESPEDAPSAKLMYLRRVSWRGRYKKMMGEICAHERRTSRAARRSWSMLPDDTTSSTHSFSTCRFVSPTTTLFQRLGSKYFQYTLYVLKAGNYLKAVNRRQRVAAHRSYSWHIQRSLCRLSRVGRCTCF